MSKILLCCFLILAVLASIGVIKYNSNVFAMVEDSLSWLQGFSELFNVNDGNNSVSEMYIIVRLGTVAHYVSFKGESIYSKRVGTYDVVSSSLPSVTQIYVHYGFFSVDLIMEDGSKLENCTVLKHPFISDLVTVQAILTGYNGSHGGGGTDF